MTSRNIRERCEASVAALPLRTPFNVTELVRDLARERRRPIHLHAEAPHGGPCGLLISTGVADHVFYDGTTTALHRQHIVLHELGHLLAEHDGPPVPDDWASRLLPSLDRTTVVRVLGRSLFADDDEAEAELFASLVVKRVSRLARSPAGWRATDADEVVQRLTVALAVVPARL